MPETACRFRLRKSVSVDLCVDASFGGYLHRRLRLLLCSGRLSGQKGRDSLARLRSVSGVSDVMTFDCGALVAHRSLRRAAVHSSE